GNFDTAIIVDPPESPVSGPLTIFKTLWPFPSPFRSDLTASSSHHINLPGPAPRTDVSTWWPAHALHHTISRTAAVATPSVIGRPVATSSANVNSPIDVLADRQGNPQA